MQIIVCMKKYSILIIVTLTCLLLIEKGLCMRRLVIDDDALQQCINAVKEYVTQVKKWQSNEYTAKFRFIDTEENTAVFVVVHNSDIEKAKTEGRFGKSLGTYPSEFFSVIDLSKMRVIREESLYIDNEDLYKQWKKAAQEYAANTKKWEIGEFSIIFAYIEREKNTVTFWAVKKADLDQAKRNEASGIKNDEFPKGYPSAFPVVLDTRSMQVITTQ